MSRNIKILTVITTIATAWFIFSSIFAWQFPIAPSVFISIGRGSLTIVNLHNSQDAKWMFIGRDEGTWEWSWFFGQDSMMDIWRIRLPLWPFIFSVITLTFWFWYRLIFRRPYLCSKCAFDLRGTVSNPAKLCNECGTPWNSDFLAAQTGTVNAPWTTLTYPLLRKNAHRRFLALVAAIVLSLIFTMLLVSSYASPQELVLGDTDLSVSRFVFWITRTIDNTRLLDSNLTIPSTARQIITSYQTMPNGSFLISIPLWPIIAATAAGLWYFHRRWMAAHIALWSPPNSYIHNESATHTSI